MPDRLPLLILGLGNLLCSDDGLGAVAVDELQRKFDSPPGVAILDGGTLGLSLLPYVRQAAAAILVDAIHADRVPGSFVRLEGRDVGPAVLHRLSVHQVGVADLLDGAQWLGEYPERVVLLGLVPDTLALGVGCSDPVRTAMPDLVKAIVDEARQLGFELVRKAEVAAPTAAVGRGDLARVLGV